MTKIAAMTINSKKPLKSSSPKTRRPMALKLDMKHQAMKLYKVCINHDRGMTTYFTARPTSKIFSKTTRPIKVKVKFYRKHLYEGGTNVIINIPGHMTKMATMPIYGKNPSKIFFTGTAEPIAMGIDI